MILSKEGRILCGAHRPGSLLYRPYLSKGIR